MEELPYAQTGEEVSRTTKEAKQLPVEPIEDDTSKWDMPLMPEPPRPSGTIKVRLVDAGRSKPMPVDDPSREAE